MPAVVYTRSLANLGRALLDLDDGDIRLLLVMTATTCDVEEDAQFISDFTVLDEMDGLNYSRKLLAGTVVNVDLANNRGEFTFDPVMFLALGNGSRQLAGVLLFNHVTNDFDSQPIALIKPSSWPVHPVGRDFLLTPNVEGVLQIKQEV